jgi:hypothetical protein
LKRKVARNSEALKFTNSHLLQVERLQEAIYNVLRKGSEPGKLVSLEAAVEKIAFSMNKLTEAWGKMSDVEDPLRLAEGQKKLGDYVNMNQADAHFAGWLMRPVCKKETRHYTKDTHDSPISKMRRIWCEDCRVVQMQFKQTDGKWK